METIPQYDSLLLICGVSALGQLHIVASTLPLLLSIHLKLITVLDYS